MNKSIKWFKDDTNLPCTNCILYADGKIIILNCTTYYNSETKKSRTVIRPLCDTTLDSILMYNQKPWVAVDEWSSISDGTGTYISGGGAYGSDGFVAHTDMEGNFIWGMFFNFTNPIKDLKIEADHLTGISEHDDAKINVDLHNLTDISFAILDEKIK